MGKSLINAIVEMMTCIPVGSDGYSIRQTLSGYLHKLQCSRYDDETINDLYWDVAGDLLDQLPEDMATYNRWQRDVCTKWACVMSTVSH
jgi:hypothetical protein